MTSRSEGGAIESFLESASIELDTLGDPPLADTEDPLLDRDRIELDRDD
jgi:hypothetical protein